MGIPAPKMMRVPVLKEYIKGERGQTSISPAMDGLVNESDTGERMAQSGYIYDPVFTQINNLMNDN